MDAFLGKTSALIILIITLPFFVLIWIFYKIENGGRAIFKQERMGKDGKTFTMYKFRTMIHGAEKLKKKYLHLNEANGPVFKIRNDPRHTKIGRFLAHTGLDELPQLINVLKGEMAIVGPRPLPLDEAKKVPKKYKARFSALPGITSPWVVRGAHKLSFDQWMKLDVEYIRRKSFLVDVAISFQTVRIIVGSLFYQISRDDRVDKTDH